MQNPLHPETTNLNNLSTHSNDSLNLDKNQNHRQKQNHDDFLNQSPPNQINLTAQQHFNNQTMNAYSADNLTLEQNNSKSPHRKSMYMPNSTDRKEFCELDEFLKEAYQKYGITELVRSFVDLQDKLAMNHQNLRFHHERQYHEQSSTKLRVRCFEETNQIEELSLYSEQNIFHEFLYNLQSYFLPSETLGINQNDQNQSQNKGNDFSFSESKPQFERSIISMKRSYRHNSRSKHFIGTGFKYRRETFQDEKMMKSINILNKPITPLKFDDLSLNKISEKSLKMTNSEILGQESIESENSAGNGQEELLKTIFELRQQNLALKQKMYNLNGSYSQNSSFYFDKSAGEDNVRSREFENIGKEDHILERVKSKQSFKLLNDFETKIRDEENEKIVYSQTHPILVQQDDESSVRLSNAMGYEWLSMLEKIEVEDDKQNISKYANCQDILYSKTNKLELLQKLQSKKQSQSHEKKPNTIQSNITQVVYAPKFNLSQVQKSKQKQVQDNKLRQRLIRIFEERLSGLMNEFMEEFMDKFRTFFKVELGIQLVLMNLGRKKIVLDRRVQEWYNSMIDWYSGLRIEERTKQESNHKLLTLCVSKKMQILEDLKKILQKGK